MASAIVAQFVTSSSVESPCIGTEPATTRVFYEPKYVLWCSSYRSCSKLSAVTGEGGMGCVRSAGSKVSPHGKGLMEGKGEQGEHNWSLSRWGA